MSRSRVVQGIFSGIAFAWLAGSAAAAPPQAPGTVLQEQKVAWSSGNFLGALSSRDQFGGSTVCLGDLDGDGVSDLAVGAPLDDDGGSGRGAVWILFMNPDGTVRNEAKISSTSGGFLGALSSNDHLGVSLALLDDLDGDGVPELAVGADQDDDGGSNRGAVWILFLDATGAVKLESKISQLSGGFSGALANGDRFGRSLGTLPDMDGDGVQELAVGADQDDDGGTNRGAVWVLYLDATAAVKSQSKISSTTGGLVGPLDNDDRFGASVTSLGDLDGDGRVELAVGADQDDDGASAAGAVYVLSLESDGSVTGETKIGAPSGLVLDAFDRLGSDVCAPGDLDGDGVMDLAAGATGDDDGGLNHGAVWVVFLRATGQAKSWQKIGSGNGGFGGTLAPNNGFGGGLAALGDLDGDLRADLAIGAELDDEGGADMGAVWVLLLDGVQAVAQENDPPSVTCSGGGVYELGLEPVTLGASVADADGDLLTYRWSLGDRILEEGTVQAPANGAPVALTPLTLSTGSGPAAMLGAGAYAFLLRVGDGTNEAVECEVAVEVVDTLAPSLALSSDVARIWPPWRRTVLVEVRVDAVDASGGPVALAAELSIESKQRGRGRGRGRRPVGPQTQELAVSDDGVIRVELRNPFWWWGGRRGGEATVTVSATDEAGHATVESVVLDVRLGWRSWSRRWWR